MMLPGPGELWKDGRSARTIHERKGVDRTDSYAVAASGARRGVEREMAPVVAVRHSVKRAHRARIHAATAAEAGGRQARASQLQYPPVQAMVGHVLQNEPRVHALWRWLAGIHGHWGHGHSFGTDGHRVDGCTSVHHSLSQSVDRRQSATSHQNRRVSRGIRRLKATRESG